MTDIQKQWLKRILAGGVGCILIVGLLQGYFWGETIPFSIVNPAMRDQITPYWLALTEGVAAAFALGAAVGVATLPFDVVGRALAVRSAAHFLVTWGLTLLIFYVYRWAFFPAALGVLSGLYTYIYLVVWLARYLGWRRELSDLRSALDLPEPAPTPLRWRESLPFLLMAGILFLLLRPLAEPFEAPDVPVLTGIILPGLAYPVAAAVSGWSAGRRLGVAPLLPVVVFLAFLPSIFLFPLAPYSWQQGAVYAALALGFDLLGAAARKGRAKWSG